MITKDEVKHIAQLARIKLNAEEVEKYQAELSAILDFVGQLAKVDTVKAEPIRQITGLESVFRKDEDRGLLDQGQGRELINQAPKHQDGFVVVPEVIKKN
ncbi:MAG: Asp-tRNA(Asn)/Glu-tRNA(Gln) amidotransferase subunit GatC [Parcubacteria group bacterium]|nr:Asp-tRNA(Asn)/Glu-tRNA(Gln) amidotransferase subunit GatC [Parcubacteria group bacterium]